MWRHLRCTPALVVFAASLLGGCGDGGSSSGARERCVRDDGTGGNVALVTVAPREARSLTIADVLRKDERFSQFRKLAEQTNTLVRRSFLETWDRPKDRLGNKPWLTVFAPTDTAFAVLDSEIVTAWEEGRLDNIARYTWLGHHSVHRPYPSTHFKEGLQNNWQPTGLGRWKKTPGRSGPVDVRLTLDPLTYGGCPILQTDLRTTNGYIHVVGGVVVTDEVRNAAD